MAITYWDKDGKVLRNRELIEQFGGELGTLILDIASNWRAHGLTQAPGFDWYAKALAEQIGAVRIDG